MLCNQNHPPMEFPFDILDYIFGFLKFDPESLVACSSAHPVFSRLVQRYLYYHIIIGRSWISDRGYSLGVSHLITLLSEAPQIVNFVRVLQIEASGKRNLQKIASILPLFPVLECAMLMTERGYSPSWNMMPQSFRTAMEDCLRLPTLQEVHVGDLCFPLSLLDNSPNINCLSLFRPFQIPDCPDAIYPQLKSLSICSINRASFITWAKQHIGNLQSLTCDYSNEALVLELLEICSETLNNLDLSLKIYEPYAKRYNLYGSGLVDSQIPLIDLSSLPHLQHLTIRAEVYFEEYNRITCCLGAAVAILKTASSALQHLTIECFVVRACNSEILPDFSPLSVLTKSSTPFRHIDLYILDPPAVSSYTQFFSSSLARYGGFKELVKRGVLKIHAEEAAPRNSRFL